MVPGRNHMPLHVAGPFYPVRAGRAALDPGCEPPDNRDMSDSPSVDPADVTVPVAHALDTLIAGAAASFGLSVLAVLATVFAAEGAFHLVAHLSLPGLMVLVVLLRVAHVLLRHPDARDDAWTRAQAVSPLDTRLARLLSCAVPLAWFVGGAAILVRHGPHFHGLAGGIGLWLPVSAALWILATFAWTDACRDRLAAGLHESDGRFREYWRNVARRP